MTEIEAALNRWESHAGCADAAYALSIVIPAFNEGTRLGPFLQRVVAYGAHCPFAVQVIVVDDGSRDGTSDVAVSFAGGPVAVSVIRLARNHGKGYAVAQGMLRAEGEVCVMMDADGSALPTEIDANLHYLQEDGCDLFVGSRVRGMANQVVTRPPYRQFLTRVLNAWVRVVLSLEIRDTQCGFKMFRREVARTLFAHRRIDGFGFDLEVLYLAKQLGYRVKEGPISWRRMRGSKVNLLADSLRMLVNVFQVRYWHRPTSRQGAQWSNARHRGERSHGFDPP